MLNSLPGGGAQPSKKIIDLVPGPHPPQHGWGYRGSFQRLCLAAWHSRETSVDKRFFLVVNLK